MLEITDEEVKQAFNTLNQRLLVRVKTIEFEIKQYKQLRYINDFARYDYNIDILISRLHAAQIIRLYILYRGKKPLSCFSLKSKYDHFTFNQIIDSYSHLLYLEAMKAWDLGRKYHHLRVYSKADRWNKWSKIGKWPSVRRGIERRDWDKIKKDRQSSAMKDFMTWFRA